MSPIEEDAVFSMSRAVMVVSGPTESASLRAILEPVTTTVSGALPAAAFCACAGIADPGTISNRVAVSAASDTPPFKLVSILMSGIPSEQSRAPTLPPGLRRIEKRFAIVATFNRHNGGRNIIVVCDYAMRKRYDAASFWKL